MTPPDLVEKTHNAAKISTIHLHMHDIPHIAWVEDAQGVCLDCNLALSHFTKLSIDHLIGQNVLKHFGSRFTPSSYANIEEKKGPHTPAPHAPPSSAQQLDANRGTLLPLTLSRISVKTDDSGEKQSLCIIYDAPPLLEARDGADETVKQPAPIDILTGLPKRFMFRESIEQAIAEAKQDNASLALIVIDLDHFQEINDSLGHDAGDAFLADTPTRLRQCIRKTDILGHLGGDEFIIALKGPHEPKTVERVAYQILRTLSEPFHFGDMESRISASIGIALYPHDGVGIDDLLKYANQAMYASKRQGRNRFTYFTQSMQRVAQKRGALISDLRKTISHFPFRLLFQPIVDLKNDKLCKAEALIRWVHPAQGIIGPDEFIPLAEEIGLIDVIGDWVFHHAAQQTAKWRQTITSEFQVSINMSPLQFRNNNRFPGSWSEHLKNIALQGNGLLLEITEGLLLDNHHRIADQIRQFHAAGIQVALDDFGTGYSSLSHLTQYDIDYIKIDRCFVQNLTADSNALALCQAMILMAHKLGIQVIAEGVECDAQRGLLKNAGCDFAQGYLFSPPISPEEFEDLLIGPIS